MARPSPSSLNSYVETAASEAKNEIIFGSKGFNAGFPIF